MNKKDLIHFQKFIELDLLEGCWLWKGHINYSGYGTFKHNHKEIRCHRASYEHWNGKIPKGLEIDHLCRNRSCCNPSHLEAVTHLENMQRGIVSRSHPNQHTNKTHCIRGHEYNEKNTNIKKNARHCRICHKERCRKYRLLNK